MYHNLKMCHLTHALCLNCISYDMAVLHIHIWKFRLDYGLIKFNENI